VLQRSIDNVVDTSSNIDWSICIRNGRGRELACCNPDRAMKTASVGKILLLVEVARQCGDGVLDGSALLARDPELQVADSGLWQHLHVDELSINDLCLLIASVSDNLATNTLLNRVGLPALRRLAESLGLVDTALLDYVRDHRGPQDPPTLSTGSASELSRLMSQLYRGELISTAVSDQVNTWLATGVDLSMVASAFHLDPLAHVLSDRNVVIHNKTGADPGVRADVGTVGRPTTGVSYAVIANWDAADGDLRDVVLSGMKSIGATLRSVLESE
jgi:beta-lactamase class A